MSDYQRETAFLRQCLLYDDTAEHRKLEESIAQLQRNERCVRRAVGLMALLAVFAMVGLSYSVIFQADQFENISQLATPLITQVFCVLGLGALICLVWFVGLGLANRRELDQRREECRRWVAKFLEVRLGKPVPSPGDIRTISDGEQIDRSARVVEAGNGSPAILESATRA
jgi:hypothetical protein